MKDLLPVLETIAKMGKPLVIIAEDVTAKPWPPWWSISSGHPPGSGRESPRLRRPPQAMLEDIAILTGGQLISEDMGWKLENVTVKELGTARKVSLDREQHHHHRWRRATGGHRRPGKTDPGPDSMETTSDYDRKNSRSGWPNWWAASRLSVSARPLKWK